MNAMVAPTSASITEVWPERTWRAARKAKRVQPHEQVTSWSESMSGTIDWSLVDADQIRNLPLRIVAWTTEGTRVYVDKKSVAMERVRGSVRLEEIAVALTFGGCRAAADRIRDLDEMTSDGDPDEPPIVVDSLRQLALFLLSEHDLVEPELALDPEGRFNAEWASPDGDVVAMKFLPDGLIRFAGVSVSGNNGPKLSIHGELPKDSALRAVLAFCPLRSGWNRSRAAA